MLCADMELHTTTASMALLLLVSSAHGLLQALLFLCPSIFPCLSPLLGLAATLEVSLLPTLVVFSILGWSVFLWV